VYSGASTTLPSYPAQSSDLRSADLLEMPLVSEVPVNYEMALARSTTEYHFSLADGCQHLGEDANPVAAR